MIPAARLLDVRAQSHDTDFRKHDGMAVGGAEARFEAEAFAMFDEPRGAIGHVLAVRRLGGDAGKAHVIAELVD